MKQATPIATISIYQRIADSSARTPLALILLVGLVYVTLLLTTALGPLNGFWSSDQGVKVIQVTSLLLNKFRTNAVIYPGRVYDPQEIASPLRDQYLQRDGETYAMFSAAFAFASSIPFFLFGYPGLYIIPIISTLLTLRACAAIGRHVLSPFWVLISILICGLVSPLFFYSLTFWEHTPATLLIVTALALSLFGINKDTAKPLFLAGFFLGAASWLRNETMLAIPALLFALLLVRPNKTWSVMVWVAAGSLLSIGLLLIFNQVAYGSFLGPHVLVAGRANYATETSLNSLITERFNWATVLLVPRIHRFFLIDLGLLAIISLAGNMLRHRTAIIIGAVAVIMLAMRLSTFIQYEISAGLHSTLIETFPIVLLCFLPLAPARSDTGDHLAAAQVATLTATQIAGLLGWFSIGYIGLAWLAYIPDGGTQWGPRVLLPAIPPLVLVALWRVSRDYQDLWYTLAPSCRSQRLCCGMQAKRTKPIGSST